MFLVYDTCMKNHIVDVVVIGGGPAGMMAAGIAAQGGARVLLIEKNRELGKKLRITGGGRCNITNAEEDIRTFLAYYKDAAKYLYSAFSQFNQHSTISFFKELGIETKIEDRGRVFPISDSAESVWQALISYMKSGKVSVMTDTRIVSLEKKSSKITHIVLEDKTQIQAKCFVLATGGLSHPETGSTGDGFKLLEKLGMNIQEGDMTLVPLKTKERWGHELSGLTLEDVSVTMRSTQNKRIQRRGRLLFTHTGLSGPMILNMSSIVRDELYGGPVILTINLFPDSDTAALDTFILDLCDQNKNKLFKNALGMAFEQRLVDTVLDLAHVGTQTFCHSLTKEQRKALVNILRELPITITGLYGADKAIVASGGISLDDIDTKTFASKYIDNLYIIGDMLDIDRPSGGFSLQLCWTTGYVAGTHAALFTK